MEGLLKNLVRANPSMFKSLLEDMASDAGLSSWGVSQLSPDVDKDKSSDSDSNEESEPKVSTSDDDMEDAISGSEGAIVHALAPVVTYTNIKSMYFSPIVITCIADFNICQQ